MFNSLSPHINFFFSKICIKPNMKPLITLHVNEQRIILLLTLYNLLVHFIYVLICKIIKW